MLLSDVLNMVYTKPLNEEYKSKIIQNLINPYFDSYAVKMGFRPNEKYNNKQGYDFYDIEFAYKNLIRNNNITREDFEDPDRRDEIINVKYIDRYKTHLDKKRNSPINRLHNILRDAGCTIDFSKIKDDDLEKIYSFNSSQLQKPKYKYGLLFWVDYYDRLYAVTYKGKTVMYSKSKFSWYKNNHSYTGPVDYNEIINGVQSGNNDALEEFIKNAFIEIPNFDPIFIESNIKSEGVKNVNKLLDSKRMSVVYFVNPKTIEKLDISDKLAQRKEYSDYLMNIFNIQKDEIHKGKIYMIKYAKSQYKYKRKETKDIYNRAKSKRQLKEIESIDTLVNDILDNMFIIVERLHKEEIEFLSSDIDIDKRYSIFNQIDLPVGYIDFFKKIMPNKFFYRKNYKDKKSPETITYMENLGDLFVVMNAYIQYVLHQTNELILLKAETLKKYDNENIDYKTYVYDMDHIINKSSQLKRELTAVYNRNHVISDVAENIKKYTNIDIIDMFQIFGKYNPKPSYYI